MMNKFLSVENMKEAKASYQHFLNLVHGGEYEETENGKIQRSSSIETERGALRKPIYVGIDYLTSSDKQIFNAEQLEEINNKTCKGIWYYKNFGYVLV